MRSKRLSLDVGDKFDNLLTTEANAHRTTKADIVRKAVATYAYLRREFDEGAKVAVTAKDGSVKEIILP